jgi:hypothetical protein
LTTKPHSITAAKPGIKYDVEPHPLSRPYRPALLINDDVVFCPRTNARVTPAGWGLDTGSRIRLDELNLDCPGRAEKKRLAAQFSVSKREMDPAAVAPRISRRARLCLIVQLRVLILVACVR